WAGPARSAPNAKSPLERALERALFADEAVVVLANHPALSRAHDGADGCVDDDAPPDDDDSAQKKNRMTRGQYEKRRRSVKAVLLNPRRARGNRAPSIHRCVFDVRQVAEDPGETARAFVRARELERRGLVRRPRAIPVRRRDDEVLLPGGQLGGDQGAVAQGHLADRRRAIVGRKEALHRRWVRA